jgi:hypothetical protein
MKVGLFIIYSAWLACTTAYFDLVKVILMLYVSQASNFLIISHSEKHV